MEQEYDTYAYFWVSDFDCDPEVISDILGLKPYRTFKKGDLISDKTKNRWKHSSWEYISTLPRSEPCQDAHIANLVEVMLKKKEAINALKEKYEIGINCVGYYHDTNPGFHMSSDLIMSCATLGISIDFDLYTVGIIEVDDLQKEKPIH